MSDNNRNRERRSERMVLHQIRLTDHFDRNNPNTVETLSKHHLIYSVAGLIVGLVCVIGGVVLFLNGVADSTSWTAKFLGAESDINDAAPGAVLFIVGLFVVFITMLGAGVEFQGALREIGRQRGVSVAGNILLDLRKNSVYSSYTWRETMINWKRLATQLVAALIMMLLSSTNLPADTSLVREKINSIKTINEDVKLLEAQLERVKSRGPTTYRLEKILNTIDEELTTINYYIETITAPHRRSFISANFDNIRRNRQLLEEEVRQSQREFEKEIKTLEDMIMRRRQAIGTLIDEASEALARSREAQIDEASQASAQPRGVQKTFLNPKVGNFALDVCLTWATDCGKPAADRWCQEVAKFKTSTAHEISKNSPPTKVIGSGQVCDKWFCGRITSVTCEK